MTGIVLRKRKMDLSASLTAADVENEDNDEGDLEVGVVADLEEEGDDDQRRENRQKKCRHIATVRMTKLKKALKNPATSSAPSNNNVVGTTANNEHSCETCVKAGVVVVDVRGSSRSLSTKSDPYLGLLDHDSKSTAKRRSSSSRRSSAAATAPIAILKPSDPISIVHSSTKWICLCCAEIHCFALKDTSNDLKHIFIHYSDSKKQHPIYMNLKTFETWCCACISTIDYSAKQNQVLMEAAAEIRKHVGSSESSNSALDISASSSTASIVAATGKNGQVIAPFTSPGKGAAKNAARNGKFKPAYPGLQNLGNTCFFNSVMQCLTYTKPLKDILVDPYSKFPIIGQLNTAFSYFLKTMHSTTAATSVSPRELFSKICGKWKIYSGFQQQDSHELLRRLLDELSEEAKKMETYMPNGSDSQVTSSFSSSSTTDPTVAKKPQSFVEHVFQGQLASLIVCNECGYISCSFEDFLDLSLPIVQPNKPSKFTISKPRFSKKKLKTKASQNQDDQNRESLDNLRRKSVESSSSRASATSNIKSSSPSKTGASYGTFPPHGSELQRPTLLCTSESASSYVENSIGSIPSGLNKLSLATPSPAQLLKSASKELSPPEQSTPSPIKIPIHQGMRQEWIDNLFHPVPPSAFSSKLDLDKCLKGFMAVESLEGDNAWACEKCALRQHQQEQAIRLQREEAIVRRNFDDSKQSLHAMSIVESIGSARTPESVSAAVFRAPSPSSIKSLSGLATLNKASLNMHHEDQEMQTSDTGGKGTIAIKDLNMSMISTELSAVDLNDTDDGDRPTILSPVPMSITSQRLVSDDENRNADSFMPTSAEPFSSSSDSSSLSSVPDCSSSDLSFLVTAKLNKKKEQKHNQQIRPTLPVQPESAVSNEFLQAASNPAKLPPVFRSARKRYLIYKLPEILVLNLKRFQQAHGILGSRRMAKIGDIVDFNQTLDLGEVLADGNTIYEILQLNKRSGGGSAVVDDVPVPPAVVAEAPIPDDRSDGEIMRKAHYKLYGVVVHSGSLFGGHYVSYVNVRRRNPDLSVAAAAFGALQPSRDVDAEHQWIHFSDTSVRSSSWDEVSKAQAYMLFFERIK